MGMSQSMFVVSTFNKQYEHEQEELEKSQRVLRPPERRAHGSIRDARENKELLQIERYPVILESVMDKILSIAPRVREGSGRRGVGITAGYVVFSPPRAVF